MRPPARHRYPPATPAWFWAALACPVLLGVAGVAAAVAPRPAMHAVHSGAGRVPPDVTADRGQTAASRAQRYAERTPIDGGKNGEGETPSSVSDVIRHPRSAVSTHHPAPVLAPTGLSGRSSGTPVTTPTRTVTATPTTTTVEHTTTATVTATTTATPTATEVPVSTEALPTETTEGTP